MKENKSDFVAADSTKSVLKHGSGVMLITLLSRICGLIRVRLEATVFGGGELASTWQLAFLIPTMFRRLFGEGAVGQVVVPIVQTAAEQHGLTEVRRRLAVILAALTLVLSVLVLLVSGASFFICDWGAHSSLVLLRNFFVKPHIVAAFDILPIIMPYAVFICLVGVLGAVLNTAKMFVLPNAMSVLMNVMFIAAFLFAYWFDLSERAVLMLFAVLTPISGLVQLLLSVWLLKYCGRMPLFDRTFLEHLKGLKEFGRLFLPGFLGFSVLQFSLAVDQICAGQLGDKAIPALSYVSRLVDLPVGILAVSLSSVLLTTMSAAAARYDREELAQQLKDVMRQVWFVSSPMAMSVVFFHDLMLRLLCVGGRYQVADLEEARLVAVFYGAAVPLFCSLKVLLPAFNARKQMGVPFYASIAAMVCNVSMNLILMRYLRQGGIALATGFSSLLNNLILILVLRHQGFLNKSAGMWWSCFRSFVVSAVVCGCIWLGYRHFFEVNCTGHWIGELIALGVILSFVIIFYLGISYGLGCRELPELFSVFRRRVKRC